jgi:hypothetical protein
MQRGALALNRLATMVVLGTASLSCTPVAFVNNTVALGGSTPGSRGGIEMQFVNNTPFRAIFTFGTYDPQNSTFTPEFGQFFVDADPANRLEGNTTSRLFTFAGSANGTTGVGRVVTVGGSGIIQFIKDQKLEANDTALTPGVTFSSSPLDSPDADQPTAGRAPALDLFIGVDYQHDSRIIFTFNVDPTQASGFRIDHTVILP